MARYRTVPRVTSACVATLAVLAVFAGAELALFNIEAWRQQAGDGGLAGRAQQQDQAPVGHAERAGSGGAAGRLAVWRNAPGVAAAARVLIASRGTGGRARRLIDIADALAVNPTSGWLWLAYAEEVLRRGYGAGDAVKALDMSMMTERREAATVLARALFVLRAWEQIPADRRAVALAQFAALRRRLGDAEVLAVAEIAAGKVPLVRAEIAATLAPKLGGDLSLLDRIGVRIPPAVMPKQSMRK